VAADWKGRRLRAMASEMLSKLFDELSKADGTASRKASGSRRTLRPLV